MNAHAMNVDGDELWPIAKAAEFLNLKVQTLYNYRSRGKGPKSQIWLDGRKRRIGYAPADVAAWRDARAAQPPKGGRPKSVKIKKTSRRVA